MILSALLNTWVTLVKLNHLGTLPNESVLHDEIEPRQEPNATRLLTTLYQDTRQCLFVLSWIMTTYIPRE